MTMFSCKVCCAWHYLRENDTFTVFWVVLVESVTTGVGGLGGMDVLRPLGPTTDEDKQKYKSAYPTIEPAYKDIF
jgi:hypothetical protein